MVTLKHFCMFCKLVMISLSSPQQQTMMIWRNPGRPFISLSNIVLFSWSASPFGLRCAAKVIRPASAHTCWLPEEKTERLNNNAEYVPLAAPSIMQCQSPRKASENPRSQGLLNRLTPSMIKVQTSVAQYILLSWRRAVRCLTVNHLWATSLSFYSTFSQTVYLPVSN